MRTSPSIAALALALSAPAAAQDDAVPLRLEVGQTVALCSTGTLLCPARDLRCDDLRVVAAGADDRGPLLTGATPGTTLCSAGSASGAGLRRVYRVTVVPARPRRAK